MKTAKMKSQKANKCTTVDVAESRDRAVAHILPSNFFLILLLVCRDATL